MPQPTPSSAGASPSRLRRTARSGVAALEFALVSPLLVMTFLATFDVGTFLYNLMRSEQSANEMTQIVTQCTALNEADFTRFFQELQVLDGKLSVSGTTGASYVTGFTSSSGANVVSWQRSTGNTTLYKSGVVTTSGTANVPEGFVVPTGQMLVVVETYTPAGFFGSGSLGLMSLVHASTAGAPTFFHSYSMDLVRTAPATRLASIGASTTATACGS